MTKFRAFIFHLIASAGIILALFGLMRWVWYPAPYFEINGCWQVWRILAGVDVVLGPLLTLIVFKPGKPSLKCDMSCIVLMQLAALIYGGTIIYQQRPEFVVFGTDRFTTVTAVEIEFDQIKFPELQRIAGIGPLLAQALPPADPKLRQELMFAVVMEGQKDLEFRAELYEPYQPDLTQLRSRSLDLDKIAALDDKAKEAIATFAAQHGGTLENHLYLPLKGKNKDIIMALSATDGMPAGFISISPWFEDYPQKPQ